MDERRQDGRYEALYTQLLERGMDLHLSNKRRIRTGLIILLLLPVILGIILKLTGSDKIVFLIIWVICMFVLCIYLISVEYIDESVKRTLEEVTERETNFDELLLDSGKLEERVAARHDIIVERLRALREDRVAARRNAAGETGTGATGDAPLLRESEDDE